MLFFLLLTSPLSTPVCKAYDTVILAAPTVSYKVISTKETDDCWISFIEDESGVRSIVKQVKDKNPDEQFLLVIDALACTIAQEQKIPMEVVAKLRFCRFSGSFEPIFDFFEGSNINFRILLPSKKAKSGQNNPENQRTLSFATTSSNQTFCGIDMAAAFDSRSSDLFPDQTDHERRDPTLSTRNPRT
jgi:hypothetical protein